MTNLQGWQKVAREIGDHHIAGWGLSVLKSGPEHAIGHWLPAEAAAKEILRLRERVEQVDVPDIPQHIMEFNVTRIAATGQWFAKGWINGRLVIGPDAPTFSSAVRAFVTNAPVHHPETDR